MRATFVLTDQEDEGELEFESRVLFKVTETAPDEDSLLDLIRDHIALHVRAQEMKK